MITKSSFVSVVAAICMFVAASAAGRETAVMENSPFDALMEDLSKSDEIARMAGYGEEKLSTVLITGTLVCTSCSSSHLHLQQLPVSGALVTAICNSNSPYTTRNKKPTWEKGVTDDNGEFIIDLPSQLHAIPDLNKACSVKVLWLPKDSPCQSSASLKVKDRENEIVLSSVGNGIRTYTAGTIQFVHKESANAEACKKISMEVTQDMLW
ncbi:hypothetical protein V2J09_003331 [Rumex salicifolius]